MKLIVVLIIIIGLVAEFLTGVWYGQETFEPQVIYEEVLVEVPVEKIVEVEKTIEVERIVEVFAPLKPFESRHELMTWQANNYIKDVEEGRCVVAALELARKAWTDGYEMSTETLGDGQPRGHEVCSTWIGDNKYFLEPSNTLSWLGAVKAK